MTATHFAKRQTQRERAYARRLWSTVWGKLTVATLAATVVYVTSAGSAVVAAQGYDPYLPPVVSTLLVIPSLFATPMQPAWVYYMDRGSIMWWLSRWFGVALVSLGILLASGNNQLGSPLTIGSLIVFTVAFIQVSFAAIAYATYLLWHGFGPRPQSPTELWKSRLHISTLRWLWRARRNDDYLPISEVFVLIGTNETEQTGASYEMLFEEMWEQHTVPEAVTLYTIYRMWRTGIVKPTAFGLRTWFEGREVPTLRGTLREQISTGWR